MAAAPSESKENDKAVSWAAGADPCTFSNLSQVITRHTHLNLSVDFTQRTLSGTVQLTMECLQDDVSSVTLDSRDLDIRSVKITVGDLEQALKFSFGEGNAKVPSYGRPLIIQLPNAQKAASSIALTIAYATSPTAEAIQWLTPQQTDGGKHPFLYA